MDRNLVKSVRGGDYYKTHLLGCTLFLDKLDNF